MFENLSIASQMNRFFINIKVDREEHPQLDEIFMVTRQLLTQEGGWPNNVFLTPALEPFYAGGTFAPDDNYGKPSFPRLLEWLNYAWTTQENSVRTTSKQIADNVRDYLSYRPPESSSPYDISAQASQLFDMLGQHHDGRSGGFFQAPKFPHECYLSFLLTYYEQTGEVKALDMVNLTLGKMATGGIYDHVGCGFHRYAVDKEWYVPHFEKMLYNQALLARLYADAFRVTGNLFFADITKSILDFVSGPLTDASGAFYAAIDAETDQVEGAYYAWKAEDIQALLSPEETNFFVTFFALADIPTFPGHKHTDGQVIVARKPFDHAAREQNIPYVQFAAMVGAVMNKLLVARNSRKAPALDNKIITSWNGLMIDAYAHAGKTFENPRYIDIARKAATYLLEHAINNESALCRLVTGGRAQLEATLEDYAFLTKGLISLWHATEEQVWLDSAVSLIRRAEELFADPQGGYYFTDASDSLWVRIKSGDDSAIPNSNAIMLHNLVELYAITKDAAYRDQAQALAEFFLKGNTRVLVEFSTMIDAAIKLEALTQGKLATSFAKAVSAVPDDVVTVSAFLFPADAKPGENCECIITLEIKDGWHINASRANQPFLVPTQVGIQGKGVQLVDVIYPDPLHKKETIGDTSLLVYEGMITITARIHLSSGRTKKRQSINVLLTFQPCSKTVCHKVSNVAITL